MFGDATPQTIVCVDQPERANFVRRNYQLERLEWARTATKHRVSKERSRHVLEAAPCCFALDSPERSRQRLLFPGDDPEGRPIEVIGVDLGNGVLLVIHSMELRKKFLGLYWEVKYGI